MTKKKKEPRTKTGKKFQELIKKPCSGRKKDGSRCTKNAGHWGKC